MQISYAIGGHYHNALHLVRYSHSNGQIFFGGTRILPQAARCRLRGNGSRRFKRRTQERHGEGSVFCPCGEVGDDLKHQIIEVDM